MRWHQGRKSNLLVTFAARVCPAYTDITANRARNDIQESLRDLGEDTPYQQRPGDRPGDRSRPPAELPAAARAGCSRSAPATARKAVSGPWGALSIVTGAYAGAVTTLPLDAAARPSGQATGEEHRRRGDRRTDPGPGRTGRPAQQPVGAGRDARPTRSSTSRTPGEYGFGALRCALDNLNGDNVEWVGFPAGHGTCSAYAYYVQPPPTSGTIIIRKQIQAPAGTSRNVHLRRQPDLQLQRRCSTSPIASGQTSAQQTFIRGQVRPGEPPWIVQELVPPNWR